MYAVLTGCLRQHLTKEMVQRIKHEDRWAPSPNKYITGACRILGLPVRVQQLSRFNAQHTLIPACIADVALQEYNKLRRFL